MKHCVQFPVKEHSKIAGNIVIAIFKKVTVNRTFFQYRAVLVSGHTITIRFLPRELKRLTYAQLIELEYILCLMMYNNNAYNTPNA